MNLTDGIDNLGIKDPLDWFDRRYKGTYLNPFMEIRCLCLLYRRGVSYYCIDILIDERSPICDDMLLYKTIAIRNFNVTSINTLDNHPIFKKIDKMTRIRILNMIIKLSNIIRKSYGYRDEVNIAIDINGMNWLDDTIEE